MYSELRTLSAGTASFYCMVERPRKGAAAPDGVFLLHGLGEDRSGHNYLWSQMARRLVSDGSTVYRCDLAGMGDSLLPLDLDLWARQLDALGGLGQDHDRIHVVARGAARCIVPDNWRRGTVVALRPCGPRDVDTGLGSALGRAVCGQVRPVPGDVGPEESRFWTALGTEVRAIGGASVSAFFLTQVASRTTPCPSCWTVLAAVHDADRVPEEAILLDTPSSLFLLEADRGQVLELVTRALAGTGHRR